MSVQEMPVQLTAALKEWAVVIAALTAGETMLLLRKGGIREQGGNFQVSRDQVLLYPTYEHQKPQALKSQYADLVQPVASGWHPETIAIQSWAAITHTLAVSDAEQALTLQPFHIWTEEFVRERMNWKARSPLSVLLLRVYRLPEAQVISYRSDYGGCRSWIDVADPIQTEPATPVLTEQDYQQQVEQIQALLKITK